MEIIRHNYSITYIAHHDTVLRKTLYAGKMYLHNFWRKIILVLLLVQKVQGIGNRCFSTVCSSWLCCVSGWDTCRELIIHRPVWTAGPPHTTITHTHIHVYYVSLLRLCILLAPTHGGTRGEKLLYTLCTRTCAWNCKLSQTRTQGGLIT